MADEKITQLDAITAQAAADLLAIAVDVAGTPITKKITLTNFFNLIPCALSITENIEIRSGKDLVLRRADEGWDWRLRQVGTKLDFHSGGDLVNPKVSMLDNGYVGIDNIAPIARLHLGDLADATPATYTGDIKLAGPTRTALEAVGGIELMLASGYAAKIQAISDAGSVLVFGLRGASATWVEAMRIRPDLGLGLQATLSLKERAAALGDIAAYGQLWVKTATPCELWFTDDAGTDTQLA